MKDSRRRPLLVALSVTLVAALAAGVGVSVAHADPLARDMDSHPIDLGDMKFPMSHQDSLFIANQLKPVKRTLPRMRTPRPGYPQFFAPQINVDPWFNDDSVKKLSHYRLGDVVAVRESAYTQLWYPGVKNYQIRFRSTDSRGYPMVASALLSIPPLAAPNKNVFVWNQPINGSGADCNLVASVNRPSTGSINAVMSQMVLPALYAGHPVLMPDGMGPRNSYAINRLSAHVVLDAMRMVHKQKKYDLSKSKFVVLGISHGGLMTGYAAAEQGTYAPELTKYINRFIIHEGAPDLIKLAQNFGFYGNLSKLPNPWGGFSAAFLIGINREYADQIPHFEQWLNDWGRFNLSLHRSVCLPFNHGLAVGHSIPTYFKDDFTKSKTFRTIMQIAKDNSLIYYPGLPKVPVMIVHGTTDEIIYEHTDDEYLFNKWCRAGVNAVYQEVPLGDHFSTVGVSMPRVTVAVMAGLNDKPQKSMCGRKVIL